MRVLDSIKETPYLWQALVAYLLLGVTDVLHHLHAAKTLDNDFAMHAVWIGLVLIPLAILCAVGFTFVKNQILLWVFFIISLLAIVGPGIYHGGWDHLVKVLGYLRIAGDTTDIRLLLPPNNVNPWIYELSGSFEFVLGAIALYFVVKLFLSNKRRL